MLISAACYILRVYRHMCDSGCVCPWLGDALPVTTPCNPVTTPYIYKYPVCISHTVISVYANQKGKSDQTGLIPILNIWVIIVGG